MTIPSGAIIPLFLVSFLLFAIQYFRLNYDRRLMNLQFGMMLGAIVLMLVVVFFRGILFSWVFFLLGLLWLGLAIYLLRKLPPAGI
jgi:predicted ferric reductase